MQLVQQALQVLLVLREQQARQVQRGFLVLKGRLEILAQAALPVTLVTLVRQAQQVLPALKVLLEILAQAALPARLVLRVLQDLRANHLLALQVLLVLKVQLVQLVLVLLRLPSQTVRTVLKHLG